MLGLGCGANSDGSATPNAPAEEVADRARKATPPKHVLVIVADSLRADHLGCYGYDRNTSPCIDRLAAQGVLFEQAFSNSSLTSESVSSLFLSQYPAANPWGAGMMARPNPTLRPMAALFREAGFATGFFTTTPVLNHPEFFVGFDDTACLVEKHGVSGRAMRLSERTLAFYEAHKDERTFCYVHYLDPHHPYQPPDDYYLRFADAVYPEPLSLYNDVRPRVPELVASGFGPGDPRFEDFVLRYDAEIAFVDDAVRALLNGLAGLGVADDLMVVIAADHGEEFLEHGFVEHAWYLYPESIHVPLIFHAPGRLEPARVGGRASLVDLLPSLLALAEVPPPARALDGAPLFTRSGGGWVPAPQSKPFVSQLLVPMRNMLHTVTMGDYLYLQAVKWMTPAECSAISLELQDILRAYIDGTRQESGLWGAPVHEALYDLARDPGAHTNVLAQHPGQAEAMRAMLRQLRLRCPPHLPVAYKAKRDPGVLTPAQRLAAGLAVTGDQPLADAELQEQLQKLKALGYLGSGAEPGDATQKPPPVSDEKLEENLDRLKSLGYL